jgi:hypothetical protein
LSEKQYDILTYHDFDTNVGRAMLDISELMPLVRSFEELIGGKSLDQIKEDSQALKVIEVLQSKISVLNTNMWEIEKLSKDRARPVVSKEEWEEYTDRIFGKRDHSG